MATTTSLSTQYAHLLENAREVGISVPENLGALMKIVDNLYADKKVLLFPEVSVGDEDRGSVAIFWESKSISLELSLSSPEEAHWVILHFKDRETFDFREGYLDDLTPNSFRSLVQKWVVAGKSKASSAAAEASLVKESAVASEDAVVTGHGRAQVALELTPA